MGKLIDTDELTKTLFHKHEMVKKQFTFPDNDYANGIIMGLGIAEATAYELPDIVHCRDCKYWAVNDCALMFPVNKDMRICEDDYCSYAERKEVENG